MPTPPKSRRVDLEAARRAATPDVGATMAPEVRALCHNRAPMKFLRMKPGHGEVLLTEGDIAVVADEERLVAEFRAQLEAGMWAAVPQTGPAGRREARMVTSFEDVPRDADRVIFFPRAAGGR